MSRKMKDSGIEWIGEIPEEWEVRKIKYVIQNSGNGIKVGPFGSSLTNLVVGYEDGKYKIYGQANLVRRNFDYGDNFVTEKTYKQLKNYEVLPNDICVSMMGTIGKCCVVSQNINKGIMDSHLIKIRLFNNEYPKFFEYCYESDMGFEQLLYNSKGTIMNGLNSFIIKNIYIPFPLLSEQQQIASFLDKKCSEIDSLTADIQKQIEILEQYKKSVITETVTKGLDPNVKMENSGIEWIGEIPENWEVISCKFCFAICNGSDPATKYGDTPVYGSGSKSFKTCEEYKDGPTVLLGRKGTVNVPQWIEGKYWNVDTAFDVKPKGNYNLRLFFYVAICFDYEKYSTQTALPSMTQADYNSFKLPYMSREEQQQIASYLDSKCSKLDELMRLKNQQLETLMQYKKSLIYEYVTGKREVN